MFKIKVIKSTYQIKICCNLVNLTQIILYHNILIIITMTIIQYYITYITITIAFFPHCNFLKLLFLIIYLKLHIVNIQAIILNTKV